MTPRAALIGVTGFGINHLLYLEKFHQAGRMKLDAAVVINPQDATEEIARLRAMGTEIFDRSDAMFEKYKGQIELCCIPTSIPSHRTLSVQAMEHGMNVLVEKPLAASVADVDAIRDAEKRTGKFTAVGFQWIYFPSTRKVKELLLSGKLGAIRDIRLFCCWPRDSAYYTRNHWVGRLHTDSGDLTLDSPLSNAMAHAVNLMLFLSGKEMATSARVDSIRGGLYRCQPIESFDTSCLEATTEAGTRLLMHVTHSCVDSHGPVIEISCEAGSIHFHRDGRYVISRKGVTDEELTLDEETPPLWCVFDAVEKRLTHPEAWICSTGIAGAHTHFIELLHENVPIIQVPADRTESRVIGQNTQIYFPGIEKRFEEAFIKDELITDLLA